MMNMLQLFAVISLLLIENIKAQCTNITERNKCKKACKWVISATPTVKCIDLSQDNCECIAAQTPSPIDISPCPCVYADSLFDVVILVDTSCQTITADQCRQQQQNIAETITSDIDIVSGIDNQVFEQMRVAYIEFGSDQANIIIDLFGQVYDNDNITLNSLLRQKGKRKSTESIYDRIRNSPICNDDDNNISQRKGNPRLNDAIQQALSLFALSSGNELREKKILIFSNCAVSENEKRNICEAYSTQIFNQTALDGVNVYMVNNRADAMIDPQTYIMCLVEYDETRIFVIYDEDNYSDKIYDIHSKLCDYPTAVTDNPTQQTSITTLISTTESTTTTHALTTNGPIATTNVRTTNNPTITTSTSTNPTTANPTPQSITTILEPTTIAIPTTNVPTTRNPTTVYPTTANPITAIPTTNVPTTINLTSANPTTANPTTNVPTTVSPTTAIPTTNVPTTRNPTTVSPTTNVPTTVSPTTINLTSANPTTINPTTVNPTTINPTTQSPTTAIPTTRNPTTLHPITANPTIKPTTVHPTTANPTTTSPTQSNTVNPTSVNPTTSSPTPVKPTIQNQTTNVPTTVHPIINLTTINPTSTSSTIATRTTSIPTSGTATVATTSNTSTTTLTTVNQITTNPITTNPITTNPITSAVPTTNLTSINPTTNQPTTINTTTINPITANITTINLTTGNPTAANSTSTTTALSTASPTSVNQTTINLTTSQPITTTTPTTDSPTTVNPTTITVISIPSVITANPTGFPTQDPTIEPTTNPSISPTNIPTNTPTIYPTLIPTLTPTYKQWICDDNKQWICDLHTDKLHIIVTFSFSSAISYNLNNIQCFLYQIFKSVGFGLVDEFCVNQIEIAAINGGIQNSELCDVPPCLLNTANTSPRRLLQTNNSNDVNITLSINTIDTDTCRAIHNISQAVDIQLIDTLTDNFGVEIGARIIINCTETATIQPIVLNSTEINVSTTPFASTANEVIDITHEQINIMPTRVPKRSLIGLWILLCILGSCCIFVVVIMFVRGTKYRQDVRSIYQPPIYHDQPASEDESSSLAISDFSQSDSDSDDEQHRLVIKM